MQGFYGCVFTPVCLSVAQLKLVPCITALNVYYKFVFLESDALDSKADTEQRVEHPLLLSSVFNFPRSHTVVRMRKNTSAQSISMHTMLCDYTAFVFIDITRAIV